MFSNIKKTGYIISSYRLTALITLSLMAVSYVLSVDYLFYFSLFIILSLVYINEFLFSSFYAFFYLVNIFSDYDYSVISFDRNYDITGYNRCFKQKIIPAKASLKQFNNSNREYFRRIFENERFLSEIKLLSVSGKIFNFEIIILKVFKILVLKDITLKKLREKVLIESEERLRSVLEYNLNLYIYVDLNGKINGFNRTAGMWFENVLGKDIVPGNSFLSIFPESEKEFAERVFKKVIKGEPVSDSMELVSIFGEIVFLEFNMVSLFSSKGRINGYSFMASDITVKKSDQNKIKALASIPEYYPDPVMRLDYSGNIIYANNAADLFLEKLNCKNDECLPKDFWIKIVNFDNFTGIFQYEWLFNSELRVYSIKSYEIPDPGYINIIAADITESVEKEKRINILYEKLLLELDTASKIINYLLPPWIIDFEKYMIFSSYEPSSKVGGDLLDVIELVNGRKLVYVGDVSGHGVQASLIMIVIKSIIKILVIENPNIRLYELLNYLNKSLCKDILKHNYLTILIAFIDREGDEIEFLNAGHPEPFFIDNSSGKIEECPDKGMIPLGWDSSMLYSSQNEVRVSLDEGRTFVLYTDGLIEAKDNAGNELGSVKLKNIISDYISKEKSIFIPHVLKSILLENGYDISEDDYTILTVRKAMPGSDLLFRSIEPDLNIVSDLGNKCFNLVLNKNYNNHLAFKAELVINELLNNIIIHGFKGIEKSRVLVCINNFERKKNDGLLQEAIRIEIYDSGIEWDINHEQINELDYLNENLSAGGRGIHIIKGISCMVNMVRYQGVNKITVVVE